MSKPTLVFPQFGKDRGPWFWLRPGNLFASRRRLFRQDNSNEWRYAFESANPPSVERSAAFGDVVPDLGRGFRIVILADTGQGTRSQYTLLPLLRAARPDFVIINGDVAYPAGELDDFNEGFFQPYNGLNVPIWATAGNHEYYSDNNGRNFYDIFCSHVFAEQWSNAGLRLVPQPGMYWELSDPSGKTPLVIIGLDSGKSGNLDGHNSFISKLFAGTKHPDDTQHRWLDWRLTVADGKGSRVVVLFHIPGLVQGTHAADTYLSALHWVLSRHRSVHAVFCGHIHNHQRYQPATFRDYMVKQFAVPAAPTGAGAALPQYVVNGNGGAALEHTDFQGPFDTIDRYPSPKQWEDYAGPARRAAEATFPGSPLASVVAIFSDAMRDPDVDPMGLQSFLMLDVQGDQIQVSRVFVDDLASLFPNRGTVQVSNPDPPLDQATLRTCTKSLFQL
jgi:hypothetical protein